MATLSYHRLKMGKLEIEKLLNLTGRHWGEIFNKKKNHNFSQKQLKLGILAKDIALYKSYVFYSNYINKIVKFHWHYVISFKNKS